MKTGFLRMGLLVLLAGILSAKMVFGAEEAPVPETSVLENVLAFVWATMQTPVGVTVVAFLLSYALGKVFTAKPTWKVYAEKYRPVIVEAIKKVEKEIPDDTPNKNLARLDAALKYILLVEPKLKIEDTKKAITAVHAEIESTL